MKWYLSLIMIFFAPGFCLQAQQTYLVKAGERITEVIPFSEIYSYPTFTEGTVLFHDGKASKGKLNYNLLLAEIQFIDSKGDTLSLADEKSIRQVLIARDTFYFSNVYVKQISNNQGVKLGERTFFKQFAQKPGAYGSSTAATAATAASSANVLVDPRMVKLNAEQEITLVKHREYFLTGKGIEFIAANKKNLLKAFPQFKNQVNNYLSSNPVDFNKLEDMTQLSQFLRSLSN